VFGEKYPDVVRVVSVGVPVDDLLRDPTNAKWMDYSVEFCGGTHVRNTREIERFVLISEEAVAKGIRRVVGVSGEAAKAADAAAKQLAAELEALAKSPHADALADLARRVDAEALPLRARLQLRQRVAAVQKTLKEQSREQAAAGAGALHAKVDELLGGATNAGGACVLVAELPDATMDQLKSAADRAKQKSGSAAVFLAARGANGLSLVAAVTDDLVKRGVKAGDWIRAVAPLVGGGGGGPPTMAQAGGKSPEKLPDALAESRRWIEQRLAS
jgi:alanyl-tRNA synthetase